MRKWKKWEFDSGDNCLVGGFIESIQNDVQEISHACSSKVLDQEEREANLNICVSADFPITYLRKPKNIKHILVSDVMQQGKTYTMVITFDAQQEKAINKAKWILLNVEQRIKKQKNRYKMIADKSPRLESPYQALNDFFSLAPVYHEALKIPDIPGVIRAKTTDYWVWGWDGITSNYATCYWGDKDFLKDMLRFYRDTADPENGIAHAYGNDMSVMSISAIPSQGMYITLLYVYYVFSNDSELLNEIYPFAKMIYQRIMSTEVNNTGLCRGSSLFPDYPDLIKETGNDISALNNSFFYCAVRGMSYLSSVMNDDDFTEEIEGVLNKIEDNYIRLFYDTNKRFVVSSIDATTLEKRNSYNSNSIKWDNSFCNELLESVHQNCMEFFEKNIVCEAGLRQIPVWSEAYDADANQLHCWWPVTGEYFVRLINKYDKKVLVDKWVGWVSYWTKKLMCPEGISCYIDTNEPETDRWTSLDGSWQAYSMRGWYQAAVHGIVGVDAEAGGLTFYPYSGESVALYGFYFSGKRFNIKMEGSGPYIDTIEIDGDVIRGTNKLPADLYKCKENISVVVKRTDQNPYPFYLEHACGLEMIQYKYKKNVITALITGAGICRIKFRTKREICVKIDQKSIPVTYNPESSSAVVKLKMTGKQVGLEVIQV